MGKKAVIKNIVALGLAQFISKILLFTFTVFVARYLKEAGFGQYSLIVTIVGFFNLFTDFGLGTIVFREVSKDYSQADKYFTNVSIIRMCLALISFIFLCLTVNILGYSSNIKAAACIYGITLLTTNIIELANSIFRAFEKMEYMAILMIVLNALILSIGMIVLKSGYGLLVLVAGTVSAGIVTVFLSYVFSIGKFTLNISLFDIKFCISLLKTCFPFMLLGFVGVVYFRIDIVLLSKIKGDHDVGLYTAAYKLMDAFMIISNSIISAVFPYISRYYESSFEKLSSLFKKLSISLFFLGLIMSMIVFIFAKPMIMALFGPLYMPSVQPLKILIWTVPLIYMNAVLLYTLIAADLQHNIVMAISIIALLNFLLNIVVIPKYGYIGSSYVTVLSELIIFVSYSILVKKKVALSIL